MDHKLEKIEWSSQMSIGSKIIDDDHKTLFSIYNSLADCVLEQKGNRSFAEILSAMTDYSLSHFIKEEQYMESFSYPGIDGHKESHKEYIKSVAFFNSRFLSSNPPDVYEVTHFLKTWWENHILNIDKKYEDYKLSSNLFIIRQELESLSNTEHAASGQQFFKEKVKMYGIRSADVTKIAKSQYKTLLHKDKSSIFGICSKLFESQILEESMIACEWSYMKRKEFEEEDLDTFFFWLSNHVTNWAVCDTFCNHTVGAFAERFPNKISVLKSWAYNPNKWLRRAAAVSLIVPARAGKFLSQSIEICDILLTDTDDMVQKGYGWLLKVLSDTHQKEIFDYVMENKESMPRTSLRYAIEKMPGNLKKMAMQK